MSSPPIVPATSAQLRAVDPLGQPLRLAAVGPDDHERIDALEPAHERGDRPPELLADGRAAALGARPDIGAVAGALDQP